MPPDETSARRHQVPGEHRRTGRMTAARRHQVVAMAGEAVADLVADQPGGAYVAVPGEVPANIAVPGGSPANIAVPGGSPANIPISNGSPANIAVPGDSPANVALPGGNAADIAVGSARPGTPTRMVARIGADPLGRTLRDHLTANAIGAETVVTAPSSPARMHHDADGLRTDREHQEGIRAVR
ncbi:hypothetical protein [Actinoallomurus sp. CA-142502]|uniref:hypothetical protein n=1 Tax=Actinoallomurus sp. CA-142502 TaxID=3239885 RepID=UPI003D8D4556